MKEFIEAYGSYIMGFIAAIIIIGICSLFFGGPVAEIIMNFLDKAV